MSALHPATAAPASVPAWAGTPQPPGHPNPEPDGPEPVAPDNERDIPTDDEQDQREQVPGRT